jgi:hypothetical protein
MELQRRQELLQEREFGLRERELDMQDRLASARIEELAAGKGKTEAETKAITGASSQALDPITPGGSPLRFNLLGNDIQLPGTFGSISDPNIGRLFGGQADNVANMSRLRQEHLFRIGNPELSGGSRRTPMTDEEMGLKIAVDLISQPSLFESDPETYDQRLRTSLALVPEILSMLRGLGKKPKTDADTDSTDAKNPFRVSRKILEGN